MYADDPELLFLRILSAVGLDPVLDDARVPARDYDRKVMESIHAVLGNFDRAQDLADWFHDFLQWQWDTFHDANPRDLKIQEDYALELALEIVDESV